jgi:DNA-binding protein H-NS
VARPKSLSTMSFDALIQLRDDVTDMLSRQATAMQEQLARLTGLDSGNGRKARKSTAKVSKLKGRKAKVKYRDKSGNKWSGRGAQPRWMTAAIKAGAKRDDFLVGKKAMPARKAKSAKRAKRPAKSPAKRPAKSPAKRPAKRMKAAKPKKRIVRRAPKISAAPAAASPTPA